jgi:hypothetical protein
MNDNLVHMLSRESAPAQSRVIDGPDVLRQSRMRDKHKQDQGCSNQPLFDIKHGGQAERGT